MQFIEFDLGHFNFFCPATGEQILGDESFDPSPATKGVWIDEMVEDPQHLDDDLDPAWETYLENLDQEEEWIDIPGFLKGVEEPDWVTFAITTSGMACGPVSSTVWIVIDMDYDASTVKQGDNQDEEAS